MSSYFSDKESEQFVHTIAQTEMQTIGEIRIHVEDLCEISPYDRAIEVFNKLGMYNTQQKTGVLIYLATEDKKLAIVGDKGIHNILGINYWDKILTEMKTKFQTDSIFDGVMHGLKSISAELITHFPEKRDPNNELSNEISYGKI